MSKDGNILLVANWESNVGYAWWLMENFWVTISDHFGKQGKVSYLIYPKITKVPESITSSGIEVYECNFKDRSLANLTKIHRLIRSNNINYIYLSDSPTHSLFYLLLRLWGIKKIVVHDHTPGDRTPATSWKKLLKRTIQSIPLYTADHFIAVSDFVYRRFKEVACIPLDKCSCATNGIIPIDKNGAYSEYARKEFNIPDKRLIIVTTGRASYYKGIDFLIKCANELVHYRQIPNLHFLFCGNGPDLGEFKALVKQYGLDQHFTFTGRRTDVREILPSCDIGFHASKGEVGYSLSILECMSAGLATIVPDLPSTSEATQHTVTGLLYRHGDIASACNAITQCLSSEFRIRLSHNAMASVAERYQIKNTNKQLILILDNLYSESK